MSHKGYGSAMKLTLEQAAARLGKSERQIRYLVQNGRLAAENALHGRFHPVR